MCESSSSYKSGLNDASDGEKIKTSLLSKSAKIRSNVFRLLANEHTPESKILSSNALDTVIWYTDDGDGRVRYSSFTCLKQWLENFIDSNSWTVQRINASYLAACDGLADLFIPIRYVCLEIIVLLMGKWPKNRLSASSFGSNSNILDHAFPRICEMVQDPEKLVRCLAVKLIGDKCPLVSEEQLLMVIEKTVLLERRVKKASYQKNDIVIKNTGCSGALIAGLEDDFHEVRSESLVSISKICSVSRKFSMLCQEIVVEMLADDIPQVRIRAVRALDTIGKQVSLRPEQMSIITAAMCEGSGRMRRFLLTLLSKSSLASPPCILNIIDALLKNLKRYPQDKIAIWNCVALIGKNNAHFVSLCLLSLLRLHPYLSSGDDPSAKEDPAYLTVAIMVLNAARVVKGLTSNFPSSLSTTELYLQELVPWLLPPKTVSITSNVKHGLAPVKFLIHNCQILAAIMKLVKCRFEKLADDSISKISFISGRELNIIKHCALVELRNFVVKNSSCNVISPAYMNWLLRFSRIICCIMNIIGPNVTSIETINNCSKNKTVSLKSALKLGLRNEHMVIGKDDSEKLSVHHLNSLLEQLMGKICIDKDCILLICKVFEILYELLPKNQDAILKRHSNFKEIELEIVQPVPLSSTNVAETKVSPTIASVGVKIRALFSCIPIELAQEKLCIVFKRPDLKVHDHLPLFHPPRHHFYPLDSLIDEVSMAEDKIDKSDKIELSTTLELAISNTSDVLSIDIYFAYKYGCAPNEYLFLYEQQHCSLQSSSRVVKIEAKNNFNM